MNKKWLLAVFLTMALVGIVYAISSIDITSVSTGVVGFPGDTVDYNITVENLNAAENITYITLISTNLVSGDYTINAPSIDAITNLVHGEPQTKAFSFAIPYVLAGTYTATITAEEAGEPSNSDTMDYTLTVLPQKDFVLDC